MRKITFRLRFDVGKSVVASSNKLMNLNLSIQSRHPEDDNVKWVETCWGS